MLCFSVILLILSFSYKLVPLCTCLNVVLMYSYFLSSVSFVLYRLLRTTSIPRLVCTGLRPLLCFVYSDFSPPFSLQYTLTSVLYCAFCASFLFDLHTCFYGQFLPAIPSFLSLSLSSLTLPVDRSHRPLVLVNSSLPGLVVVVVLCHARTLPVFVVATTPPCFLPPHSSSPPRHLSYLPLPPQTSNFISPPLPLLPEKAGQWHHIQLSYRVKFFFQHV